MNPVEILDQIVNPVLRGVLREEDQLLTIELVARDRDRKEFELTLRFPADEFTATAYSVHLEGLDLRGWRRQLVDLLQDFVSESSFGWGQLRDFREPRTRSGFDSPDVPG